MMTLEDARTAVARGAALLDTKYPGWAVQVHPDSLEMASCTQCVLGQIYLEYEEGLRHLGLELGRGVFTHGFSLSSLDWPGAHLDDYPGWEFLKEAWVEAIQARRRRHN